VETKGPEDTAPCQATELCKLPACHFILGCAQTERNVSPSLEPMVFAQHRMWRIIKTVDQNPGAGATTSTVVDLQAKAVDIACRLGNLASFIPATNELLTCKLLPPNEFKRNCKKVG